MSRIALCISAMWLMGLQGTRADVFVALGSGPGSGTAFTYQRTPGGFVNAGSVEVFAFSTSGLRVASGDVTGDGVPDLIAGSGPGGSAVRVLNGQTGAEVMGGILPYTPFYTGGVFVASGDFNDDGYADIVTAPDQGLAPDVRVYDGRTGATLLSFIAGSPQSSSGARIAVGDVTGDGRPEIIAADGADGAGGSGQVRIYSGSTGSLLSSFQSASPFWTGGLMVAAGDLNGDGYAEIVTNLNATESKVTYYSGVTALSGSPTILNSFYGISPQTGISLRLAVGDADGDGVGDVAVATGPGALSVDIYAGVNATFVGNLPVSYDGSPPGTFVALSPLVIPEPGVLGLLAFGGVIGLLAAKRARRPR